MNDTCEAPFLIRGDIVTFEMEKGPDISLPKSWGIIHDPVGTCFPRCELFIAPYRKTHTKRISVDTEVASVAEEYFGSGKPMYEATIDIPVGPWNRVGRTTRILYDRYGELQDAYQHPFERPVPLYRQVHAQLLLGKKVRAYRLALPDACIINAHGFVWP